MRTSLAGGHLCLSIVLSAPAIDDMSVVLYRAADTLCCAHVTFQPAALAL